MDPHSFFHIEILKDYNQASETETIYFIKWYCFFPDQSTEIGLETYILFILFGGSSMDPHSFFHIEILKDYNQASETGIRLVSGKEKYIKYTIVS